MLLGDESILQIEALKTGLSHRLWLLITLVNARHLLIERNDEFGFWTVLLLFDRNTAQIQEFLLSFLSRLRHNLFLSLTI